MARFRHLSGELLDTRDASVQAVTGNLAGDVAIVQAVVVALGVLVGLYLFGAVAFVVFGVTWVTRRRLTDRR